MAHKFTDPLFTPRETARHLQIPERTVHHWLREEAGGAPLVHHVEPERRGRPSLPFVSVVEAYVLRSEQEPDQEGGGGCPPGVSAPPTPWRQSG